MVQSKRKTHKDQFYKILARVEGLLNYYAIDYAANFSYSNANRSISCYLTYKDLTIRVSNHGDKRHNFMYNFRSHKTEAELAKELLALRKFIVKARQYGIY